MVVSWSYNSGTSTASASGAGSTNFAALVAADTAGGWGKYTSDASGTQIICAGKIVIGDGTNACAFTDTKKQILFLNGIFTGQWQGQFINVLAHSSFTIGTLTDATTKSTQDGCIISCMDTNQNNAVINQVGTVQIYSSTLMSTSGQLMLWCASSGIFKIYNSNLNCVDLYNFKSFADIYNVNIMGYTSSQAAVFCGTCTYDRLNVFSNSYALHFYGNVVTTIKNAVVTKNTYPIYVEIFTVDGYLINGVFDTWHLGFSGNCTGKVFRQYEFDLTVRDSAGTALQSCTCVLKDVANTQIFSVSTDAAGAITTQTVSRGYYNQANGDTLQDYGPHTLTITKAGYATYTAKVTFDMKLNLRIALTVAPSSGGRHHLSAQEQKDLDLLEPSLMLNALLLIQKQKLKEKQTN
jgi:hypothetical protein